MLTVYVVWFSAPLKKTAGRLSTTPAFREWPLVFWSGMTIVETIVKIKVLIDPKKMQVREGP